MHTFTALVKSLAEVMAIALVLGVGVPLIFAIGIRFWSMEPATADGRAVTTRYSVPQLVAYLCFAVVAIVVGVGILYVARDFISHTFDIQLLGAKPKKK
ncbi:hypothetical protein AB0N05_33570 [Nocardia sp. NPDC051030]|uniref:hypothetical protein n=1 Tax=Nocardia sp. NPDC051030 TaxID=3155162 RepID=UPI0034374A90